MTIRLNEINTIIFDLGQVIVDLNPQLVLDRFQKLIGDTNKTIPELIKDTQLLIQYEKGLMSTKEFIDASNDFLGSKIESDQFIEAWNLMIGDIPERRLNLMNNLKENFKVMVLSNTNEMHEIYFERKIGEEQNKKQLADYAHHVLYSHRIGLRKPEQSIYQYVIDRYLDEPSKALFLDDKLENVDAAILSGLNSIQVKYPDQIFEILGVNE
ncbi:MAG: HAD superfamily hydrolase (TIGR01509 family) [Cyclobacteriaceae bacterium]